MTCRVPAAEGMRIEVQNVVGSKDTDLLRVADWFFPEGMNHHELFAGVPGLQQVLQGFARRVAGLGKLPGSHRPAATAKRREVDALVVGAGPAGMAAALALAAQRRRVEVVDDDLAWGGSARILLGAGDRAWAQLVEAFAAAVLASRIRVSPRTTAAGIYGDDVLLAYDAGDGPHIEVVRAAALVLAPGAHDAVARLRGERRAGHPERAGGVQAPRARGGPGGRTSSSPGRRRQPVRSGLCGGRRGDRGAGAAPRGERERPRPRGHPGDGRRRSSACLRLFSSSTRPGRPRTSCASRPARSSRMRPGASWSARAPAGVWVHDGRLRRRRGNGSPARARGAGEGGPRDGRRGAIGRSGAADPAR